MVYRLIIPAKERLPVKKTRALRVPFSTLQQQLNSSQLPQPSCQLNGAMPTLGPTHQPSAKILKY